MKKMNKALTGLVAIGVLFVVAQLFHGGHLMGDCDEREMVFSFLNHTLLAVRGNPVDPSAHTLTSVLSYFSMKVGGGTLFWSRFAGMLISSVSLVVLALLCLRYLSAATTIFVFANLAVNETLNWFFHSNRGYPVVFALSVVLPLGMWQLYQKGDRRRLTTFCLITFLIAALSQQMNLVFYCATAFALGVCKWRENRHDKDLQYWARLQGGLVAVSLLLMAGAVKSLQARKLHYFEGGQAGITEGPPRNLFKLGPETALATLGNFELKYQLGIALLLFLLAFRAYGQKRLTGRNLFFLQTLIWNTVALVILAFLTPGWAVRYVLYMALPLLFLAGELMAGETLKPARYVGYAVAAILFVWGPLWQSNPWIATNFCHVEYVHRPLIRTELQKVFPGRR